MPSNPDRSPTSITVRYASNGRGDDEDTMNSLLRFLKDSTGMIENIYTDDLKDFDSYTAWRARNNRLSFLLKIWGFPDKYIIRVVFDDTETQTLANDMIYVPIMREKFMTLAIRWWRDNKDAYLNPTVKRQQWAAKQAETNPSLEPEAVN